MAIFPSIQSFTSASKVTESKYSSICLLILFQIFFCIKHSISFLSSLGDTIFKSPSKIFKISPTVISAAVLAKKYPPCAPFLDVIIPPFLSIEKICSKYLSEIFCLYETLFSVTASLPEYKQISIKATNPYFPLLEIII